MFFFSYSWLRNPFSSNSIIIVYSCLTQTMAMSMVLILTLAMKHYQHVIIHVHMFTIFSFKNISKNCIWPHHYDHRISKEFLNRQQNNNWTSEFLFKVLWGLEFKGNISIHSRRVNKLGRHLAFRKRGMWSIYRSYCGKVCLYLRSLNHSLLIAVKNILQNGSRFVTTIRVI